MPADLLTTEAVVTTDHDEIREWTEEHDGRPVVLLGTGDVAIDLRNDEFDVPARPVEWDEWFAAFEDGKRAFLYQSRRADGTDPTYNCVVAR